MSKLKATNKKAINSEVIGIPVCKQRPKEIHVYKLWYHPIATLDHQRYPGARSLPVEDSPMFATRDEADKYSQALEKKDKKNIYFGRMMYVYEADVPADILKKIKKRGY